MFCEPMARSSRVVAVDVVHYVTQLLEFGDRVISKRMENVPSVTGYSVIQHVSDLVAHVKRRPSPPRRYLTAAGASSMRSHRHHQKPKSRLNGVIVGKGCVFQPVPSHQLCQSVPSSARKKTCCSCGVSRGQRGK